jgi:hypothetical protein
LVCSIGKSLTAPLGFFEFFILTISQSGIKYGTNQGVAIGGVRTLIEKRLNVSAQKNTTLQRL